MKTSIIILILITFSLSCNTNRAEQSENENISAVYEISFDKEKWRTKEGKDYPFREGMLNEILYTDTVRSLNKYKALDLLGEPDRSNENYLYYMIDQKRLGSWVIHSKTMVIKFTDDITVEWIKIHE